MTEQCSCGWSTPISTRDRRRYWNYRHCLPGDLWDVGFKISVSIVNGKGMLLLFFLFKFPPKHAQIKAAGFPNCLQQTDSRKAPPINCLYSW